jgi:hypothetical protein
VHVDDKTSKATLPDCALPISVTLNPGYFLKSSKKTYKDQLSQRKNWVQSKWLSWLNGQPGWSSQMETKWIWSGLQKSIHNENCPAPTPGDQHQEYVM